MAGSLVAPTKGSPEDFGEEAHYVVAGTGDSTEGKIVPGFVPLDPATGKPTSPGSGGTGGGGGAVTVADGADVALGHIADVAAPWNGSDGTATILMVLAALWGKLNTLAGAISSGNMKAILQAGTALIGKVGIDQTTPGVTNAVQVTGTMPLPTGAATAAKQPALGTAGAPSADVISTQGAIVSATLQAAAGATGPGTTLNVAGMATAILTISGSFVGTITFEVTEDGTTWTAIGGTQIGGLPPTSNTATAPGVFQFSVAGFTGLRARVAWVSGAITVTGHAVPAPFSHRGVLARTNTMRNTGILHRNAITAADTLATVGTITLSAVASSTALSAVAYYVSAVAGNRWGNALAATIQTITPSATNLIRAAFAQVAGADYYDIFMSTASTGPLWVGRITETQRASGIILTAVGTTGAGGTAGAVDIKVVGTGLGSNVAPFTVNNAYTPATPTAINCAGYSLMHIHSKMALTDLRSLPTLKFAVFLQDQTSTGDWFQTQLVTQSILTASGQCLEQDIVIQLDGATGAVVLLDTISGQGAAWSAWVELS